MTPTLTIRAGNIEDIEDTFTLGGIEVPLQGVSLTLGRFPSKESANNQIVQILKQVKFSDPDTIPDGTLAEIYRASKGLASTIGLMDGLLELFVEW